MSKKSPPPFDGEQVRSEVDRLILPACLSLELTLPLLPSDIHDAANQPEQRCTKSVEHNQALKDVAMSSTTDEHGYRRVDSAY